MAHFISRQIRPIYTAPAGLAASLVLGLALLLAPQAARADAFVETYLNPGVGSVTASTVCLASNCAVGTETFNELKPGNDTGTTLSTDFGTGGQITGTLTGNYAIQPANQVGGAGGTGNYLVTYDHNAGYSLTLNDTATGGGVNYFGMDLTALDPGNNLAFYNGSTLVATYTPQDLIKSLGTCPSGYCGNPSPAFAGQDGGEQFAFVNFYDQSGTFNKVVFTEGNNWGGGYEVDNFTVAYRTDTSATPGTIVPAPLPLPGGTLVGAAVLAAGFLLHRRHGRRELDGAAA